ncbi:hypothetical protein PSET11_02009 [Arthrobacter ulcerisalmonis]|uniref:Uncharacterized protein n=1 Tax=Arthrobacter ulcerisalmonis TaxID=2483813 RepID=A0A3P5XGG6_9MICC|nr:DUF5719 family protein [Arthrobacter ulcerisalmonis]VDC27718.1 hypothetical protein PSET11_02009 [Arthrobacter ulcerisalmonis]
MRENSPAASTAAKAPAAGGPRAVRPATEKPAKATQPRRKAAVAGFAASALVLVGAGAVVVAGSLLPATQTNHNLAAVAAAVPAGTAVGVCPGPARLVTGTEAGTDPQFSPESATATSTVTGLVLGAAGAVPASELARLDGSTIVEVAKEPAAAASGNAASNALAAAIVPGRQVDQVSVLAAKPLANQTASAAAATKFTATDGDLRGLAAANCQQPSNDQWLAGASTTVGRASVLNLTNASTTPATVSLELFGSAGEIQAPGSRGLLVAPGATRSVVLAGLAPSEEQLSVRVRSAGGPVAAVIQQSVLRGLTPGGVDFITPGAAPSTRQVMTGIDIQDAAAVNALIRRSGFQDAGPALELTVPGPSDAVVEISVFGRDGKKVLPSGGVVTAKAGTVTSVSLAGVPAGQYTVAASSDVSFVATTRLSRGVDADQPTDAAWAASGIRLGSQHVVPVPRGGVRQLVFGVLDGRATITYAAVTADGKVKAPASADIAGGTTAAIGIPEQADGSDVVGYVVSASGDAAYGAVLLQRSGANDVSSLTLPPAAAGQESVAVALGY